jgi:hypothetical protein
MNSPFAHYGKLKVGTKVRIRNKAYFEILREIRNREYGFDWPGPGINEEMSDFYGTKTKITNITIDGWYMLENNPWSWSDWMLESVKEQLEFDFT